MQRSLALAVWCCLANCVYGQLVVGESSVIETYGNDSIPNISNPLSLVGLARNISVQSALKLSEEQVVALDDYFRRNGGSLSVVFQSASSRVSAPSVEEQLSQRREVVDELLTPTQWNRLRQIAYQVEIARVGLAHAVTEGRLSRDAGIHENQKSNLRSKASRIENEVLSQLTTDEGRAQQALFDTLSPEKSNRAKELLGAPFYFQEDSIEERKANLRLMRNNRFGIRYAQLPIGQNKIAHSSLLLNKSVRREVGFDQAHGEAFLVAVQKNFGRSLENLLDESVSPAQWTRLRQLAYQIEIDRLGLQDAMLSGNLGKELGLNAAEKDAFVQKARELEVKSKLTYVKAWQEAQAELMRELSPQQRSIVNELLGEPFQFRDEDYKHYLQ